MAAEADGIASSPALLEALQLGWPLYVQDVSLLDDDPVALRTMPGGGAVFQTMPAELLSGVAALGAIADLILILGDEAVGLSLLSSSGPRGWTGSWPAGRRHTASIRSVRKMEPHHVPNSTSWAEQRGFAT